MNNYCTTFVLLTPYSLFDIKCTLTVVAISTKGASLHRMRGKTPLNQGLPIFFCTVRL